jgi:1,4-dihydroxy-2-naphthoate polyprenyltransferase
MNAGQILRLARVPTLAATAVPIFVGGALGVSQGRFSVLLWLDIFLCALLMQIGTNVLNEYGDYRNAVDTQPSPGIAGVIVSGEMAAKEVFKIAVAVYSFALILGLILVSFRGIEMLFLGGAAALAGILYSAGPLPVSSTPFGETLVGLVMGPVEVISATLAASGRTSNLDFVFSIPVSLMVAAILLTNNLRDFEKDRGHGRRTLPVVIGRGAGSKVLLTLVMLTFLWSFPAFLFYPISASVFLLWVAFPLALWSVSHLSDHSWEKSVPTISRLDILVGLLLTLSILVRLSN